VTGAPVVCDEKSEVRSEPHRV